MLIWKDASSFQNLQHAFPGQGQMKPKQLEIERRRREVNKLKAERDIPIKAAAYFAKCSVTRRTPARTNIQIRSDAANRFPRDWREVGDTLFAFTQLPPSQWEVGQGQGDSVKT